jgi:hypothetical protein
MDMRFGMWNIRSLYRAGSLITVWKDSGSVEVDGRAVAPHQQENTHFSMERE